MRGSRQVEVESDNALLINSIRNGFAANSNTVEVQLIHELCNRDCQVKLRHVLRESNKVADCLEKIAGGRMNQLVVLVDPSSHIRRLLEEDIDSLMGSGIGAGVFGLRMGITMWLCGILSQAIVTVAHGFDSPRSLMFLAIQCLLSTSILDYESMNSLINDEVYSYC
ncbi:hypothetical protein CXB51_021800 [Gossypium anomalum]|uniref:RNase H type-1 domain-containing protein n=1 Tax=Gossypium anomalum TaxID=47600 RepID=A0A8J5YYB1_9ROSI|nr:hypothetical protein CXB51_021800 [Gossypium anomalum]